MRLLVEANHLEALLLELLTGHEAARATAHYADAKRHLGRWSTLVYAVELCST